MKHTSFRLLLLLPWFVQGQVILLQNPSFEDMPGNSRTPRGWFYCGDPGETPTDIHPAGIFGVTHEAAHGMTYIGMVTRETGSWEGISQWLSEPLEAGQCYRFALQLARSPDYQSISRSNWQMTNFNQPVRLLIWGGNLNCERQELLAESPLIEHTDWQSHVFHFQPSTSFSRLLLEVQYAADAEPYCGNLLLDHVAPVVAVECASKEPTKTIEKIQLPDITNPTDIQSFTKQAAPNIQFSEVDHRLEQHAFYVSDGKLEQGNKYLYTIVKAAQLTDFRKLIIYIPEPNKDRWQTKAESMVEALRCLGLSYQEFRIRRRRTGAVSIEVK